MKDMFEGQDRVRMCDEIAAFFKEEHELELGVIGTGKILDFFRRCSGIAFIIRRWMMRSSFTKDMRIIWRRITTPCIRMCGRERARAPARADYDIYCTIWEQLQDLYNSIVWRDMVRESGHRSHHGSFCK